MGQYNKSTVLTFLFTYAKNIVNLKIYTNETLSCFKKNYNVKWYFPVSDVRYRAKKLSFSTQRIYVSNIIQQTLHERHSDRQNGRHQNTVHIFNKLPTKPGDGKYITIMMQDSVC